MRTAKIIHSVLGLALTLAAVAACQNQEGAGEIERAEPAKPLVPEVSQELPYGAVEGANDKLVEKNVADNSDTAGVDFSLAVTRYNEKVVSDSRLQLREAENLRRELSSTEKAQALRAIAEVRDILAGRATSSNLLCLPSSQKAGKFCMKSITGDNTCVGNYFDSAPLCKLSLSSSRSGRACYQSASKPGKAAISLIASTTLLIGNYYSNFDSCIGSMKSSYGSLVCMESARYSGKWFIADLDRNALQIGGYFDSFSACASTF